MYGVVYGVVEILLILAELQEVPIICNQPVGGSNPSASSQKASEQIVLRLFCF